MSDSGTLDKIEKRLQNLEEQAASRQTQQDERNRHLSILLDKIDQRMNDQSAAFNSINVTLAKIEEHNRRLTENFEGKRGVYQEIEKLAKKIEANGDEISALEKWRTGIVFVLGFIAFGLPMLLNYVIK